MRGSQSPLLWLTSCLASCLAQVQSKWIPSSEFLRLWWPSSVVVGEYLYIVGGELASLVHGQVAYEALNQTLTIPLSTSWTNSTVLIGAADLPSSFPLMKIPTLWFDKSSNTVWFFNGETSTINPTNAFPLSIWAFSPDGSGGGTWKENNSPSDTIFNNLTRSNECGSTFSPTTGYCLGGYASGSTTPTYDGIGATLALSGIQIFNFADKSWSNISSVGSSVNGWNSGPVFQYVPAYGESGIIVLIGGDTPTVQSDANNISGQEPLRPMSNITIYDIYNKQWLSQTATGDVPMERMLACFVGAQGGDNSTYEIFIFGGFNGTPGPNNADSLQVYVLSLPAFRWFRTTGSTAARVLHTCNVVGNRQMLTFGGLDPTTTSFNESMADALTYGRGIFDMTTWNWSSSYVADAAPYKPASQVYQFYSAGSKYPSWDNSAIQALFEANTTTSTTPLTSTSTSALSSNPPSSSSSTPPSNSSSSSAGAIAGGVVGGIAFLALVGAATWFFMRRRRQYHADTASQKPPVEMPTGRNRAELGTDMRYELGPGVVEERRMEQARPSEATAW